MTRKAAARMRSSNRPMYGSHGTHKKPSSCTIVYTLLVLAIALSTGYYVHAIKAACRADVPAFDELPGSQCLHWRSEEDNHQRYFCPARRFYFDHLDRIPMPPPPTDVHTTTSHHQKASKRYTQLGKMDGSVAKYSLEELRCEWLMPQRPNEVNSSAVQHVFVFFVPGNSGRGTQGWYLSCAIALHAQASNTLMRHDTAEAPVESTYEVNTFTFDFAHEANVHRGRLLGLQANYVADRIEEVMVAHEPQCTAANHSCAVWIAAHSMGGIVARTARVLLSQTVPLRGLVTVNSPHSHPPLFLDAAMYRLYERLALAEQQPARHSPGVASQAASDTTDHSAPLTAAYLMDGAFFDQPSHCTRDDGKKEKNGIRCSPTLAVPHAALWSFTSGEMDLQIEPASTWLPLQPRTTSGNTAVHNVNWFAPHLCGTSRSHDEALHDACGLTLIAKIVLCTDRLKTSTTTAAAATSDVDEEERRRYNDECDYLLHHISVNSPAALNAPQLDSLFSGARGWLVLWGRLCTQRHLWPMATTMGTVYLLVPNIMHGLLCLPCFAGRKNGERHGVLIRRAHSIAGSVCEYLARHSSACCTALFYLVLYVRVVYHKTQPMALRGQSDCAEDFVTLCLAVGPLLVGHMLARIAATLMRLRVALNEQLIRWTRRHLLRRLTRYSRMDRTAWVLVMALCVVMYFVSGCTRVVRGMVWLEVSEFLAALQHEQERRHCTRAVSRETLNEAGTSANNNSNNNTICAAATPAATAGQGRLRGACSKPCTHGAEPHMTLVYCAFVYATLLMPFFALKNAVNDDLVYSTTYSYLTEAVLIALLFYQCPQIDSFAETTTVTRVAALLTYVQLVLLVHLFADYRAMHKTCLWQLSTTLLSWAALSAHKCEQQRERELLVLYIH